MNTIQFCYIPAGPFLMGNPEDEELAFDDEYPQHELDLRYDYWLARFPVTVTQFTTFIQQTAHFLEDGKPLLGIHNYPVVRTTWYDALAFCRWLNEQWQKQGLLPTGWEVTLPSEAEWEKGARGGLEVPATPVIKAITEIEAWQPQVTLTTNDNPQRHYPWGNEVDPSRANYDQSGIGQPSPVGQYPAGASLYGCEEMSGNAEEWTRSHAYRAYPYNPTDGREDLEAGNDIRRVLRGGGYNDMGRSIRCSIRFYLPPRGKVTNSGFRLVIKPEAAPAR